MLLSKENWILLADGYILRSMAGKYSKVLVRMPADLKAKLDARAQSLKLSTTAFIVELLELGIFANFQLSLPDHLLQAVQEWGRLAMKRRGIPAGPAADNLPMVEQVLGGLELCKFAEAALARPDMLLISEGDLRELIQAQAKKSLSEAFNMVQESETPAETLHDWLADNDIVLSPAAVEAIKKSQVSPGMH